jgi:hypothetical protein
MIKIKQSERNTNKHTEVGMELLGKSVSKYGVLESISVSDTGEIISGNGRKEIFDKQGLTAVEIHLKENEYPVIVTSIKSDTKEFYEAQIIANTTSEKNYNLDTELVDVLVEEFDIDVEELGVEVEDVDFDTDDFGTDFKLPDGDKAPFQQMTFTIADQQAEKIKNAITDIKKTEDYKYAETMGNENSNGNALYLIIMQWEEQRK